MINKSLFCSTLVNQFFNVETVDLNNPTHWKRIVSYNEKCDLASGLFAWDGINLELIQPENALILLMILFYPNNEFMFVKPFYRHK
jgi:hypothetical protein